MAETASFLGTVELELGPCNAYVKTPITEDWDDESGWANGPLKRARSKLIRVR